MNNPAGRKHINVKTKGGGLRSWGYHRYKLDSEDKVEGGGYSISYKPSHPSHQERKRDGKAGRRSVVGTFLQSIFGKIENV